MSRRLRMEWRAPGIVEVQGRELGTFRDGEKVRILVVKSNEHDALTRVRLACEDAGMFPGAVVLRLPIGAEFEVWEEP